MLTQAIVPLLTVIDTLSRDVITAAEEKPKGEAWRARWQLLLRARDRASRAPHDAGDLLLADRVAGWVWPSTKVRHVPCGTACGLCRGALLDGALQQVTAALFRHVALVLWAVEGAFLLSTERPRVRLLKTGGCSRVLPRCRGNQGGHQRGEYPGHLQPELPLSLIAAGSWHGVIWDGFSSRWWRSSNQLRC